MRAALTLCLLLAPAAPLAQGLLEFRPDELLTAEKLNGNFTWLAELVAGLEGRIPEVPRGLTRGRPAASCAEAREDGLPSGVTWVLTARGEAEEEHCEQRLEGGGWMLLQNSAPGPLGLSFWRLLDPFQRRGQPGLYGDFYNGPRLFPSACPPCAPPAEGEASTCVYGCALEPQGDGVSALEARAAGPLEVMDVVEDAQGRVFPLRLGTIEGARVTLSPQGEVEGLVARLEYLEPRLLEIDWHDDGHDLRGPAPGEELLAAPLLISPYPEGHTSLTINDACRTTRPLGELLGSKPLSYYFGCTPGEARCAFREGANLYDCRSPAPAGIDPDSVTSGPSARLYLLDRLYNPEAEPLVEDQRALLYTPVRRLSRFIRPQEGPIGG